MPHLVFSRRAEELMTVRVRNGLVVGRDPSCDAYIPDPTVSRRQFALQQASDGWVLVDLSGKGTDVAGKPERRALLQDGIDIGLGRFRVVFFEADGRVGHAPDTLPGHDSVTETLRLTSPGESRPSGAPPFVVEFPGGEALPFSVEERVSVGSGPEASLRIKDPHVSAVHCHLEPARTGIRVTDADSKNGMYLGTTRVFDLVVQPGVTLRLGETELRVSDPSANSAEAFDGLLGRDPEIQRIFRTIQRVARSKAPVLIFGETGTGKELVAQALHARSSRADGPFEAVNCGALTPTLVESTLFGHMKGAFTGADKDTAGAFERAHQGTIFLDELGELEEVNQAKLLRVLETGRVQRVGGATAKPVDFRVVAATNVNLQEAVRAGEFREDLFYRLNVIPIVLPPLRARRGDLRALIEHFVQLFEPEAAGVPISPAAMKKLLAHEWPGNVRELRNIVQRALMLRAGSTIEADDISFEELKLRHAVPARAPNAPFVWQGKTMKELRDELTRIVVAANGGNVRAAARQLDVSPATIYARLGPRDAAEFDED